MTVEIPDEPVEVHNWSTALLKHTINEKIKELILDGPWEKTLKVSWETI